MFSSHYTTLGVQRTASQDEIRLAYKAAALKWHPDKNLENQQEASEKFRALGDAYAVLSDATLRGEYDLAQAAAATGRTVFKPRQTHHFQQSNFFQYWQTRHFQQPEFQQPEFTQTRNRTTAAPFAAACTVAPVTIVLWVTLEELFSGTTKQRRITSSHQHVETVDIHIPAGQVDGTQFSVKAAGNVCPVSNKRGDVVFEQRTKRHALFRRRGNGIGADLVYTHTCSLKQALLGPVFTLQGVDKQPIVIDCSNDVVVPTFYKHMPLHGLPTTSSGTSGTTGTSGGGAGSARRGDLFIEFDIVFHTAPLSENAKRMLTEVEIPDE